MVDRVPAVWRFYLGGNEELYDLKQNVTMTQIGRNGCGTVVECWDSVTVWQERGYPLDRYLCPPFGHWTIEIMVPQILDFSRDLMLGVRKDLVLVREEFVSQEEISDNSDSLSADLQRLDLSHWWWVVHTWATTTELCIPFSLYFNLNVMLGPWRWAWRSHWIFVFVLLSNADILNRSPSSVSHYYSFDDGVMGEPGLLRLPQLKLWF